VPKHPFDPVTASLKQRLEYHYRTNFPRLVKKLEADGRFEEFLLKLKERWQDVVDQQLRSGKLEFYQAEELADDVVFQKPSPTEREEQSQE
jgi:polyhydroxyalkanoate synthesis regulator phasin